MRCKGNGFTVGVLAFAVLSAMNTAQAQEHSTSHKKHRHHKDMEVMVVTASGVAQQLKQAPASISVIDSKELSQRFYKDLTDAMTEAPGVIVTGGGDRKDISLRGMSSAYTLILVDGKRQSSRETRPNSDGPGVEGAWTPPISAIERIEVIRGPMSSLYGSDAIGGVINIITRKTPEEWRSEIRVDGTLQEHSESGNSYQTNFFTSGSLIEDTLGMQLFAGYTRRLEDEIVSGYRDKTAEDVNLKLAYTPNHDHEILFEAGSARQSLDASVGKTIAPLEPGEECGRWGCPESSHTVYDSKNLSIAHNGQFGVVGARSYLKRDEYENKARLMTITNTDFQSHWNVPVFDDGNVNLGVAYQKEELEDLTSNQVSERTRIEGSQWSAFAETAWPLFDAFKLTTGLRYDDDDIFGGHWSPRVYGVYTLNKATTIKGGVSTGFRAPGLRQTTPDWGQVSGGGDIYGNPNLKAENSTNYELGLYTDWGRRSLSSVTVFYNEFDDKITRVACPASQCEQIPNQFGSLPTTRVNIDEAVTQGVEITLSTAFNREWSFKGNYTYTDSEQKSGEYQGEPLNQLPKHLVQTSLNWTPSKRWNGWLRVHYRGKESQPTTGPSQRALIAPSYTSADVGVNYYVTRDLKLGAGIYNALDKQVDYDEYGYVEDGRRLWLSAAYSF